MPIAAGRLFSTSRGLVAPAAPPNTEVATAKVGSSRIKLAAAQLTPALEGAELAADRQLLPSQRHDSSSPRGSRSSWRRGASCPGGEALLPHDGLSAVLYFSVSKVFWFDL